MKIVITEIQLKTILSELDEEPKKEEEEEEEEPKKEKELGVSSDYIDDIELEQIDIVYNPETKETSGKVVDWEYGGSKSKRKRKKSYWVAKDINISGSNTLILGITFKENCPDVRNTKVVDVVNALKAYGTNITIYDPWANEEEVLQEYGVKSSKNIPNTRFDAVVLAVAHDKFMNLDFSILTKDNSIIYDVKNILPTSLSDRTL